MGKSAKIRRLNELCKSRGLGRFYKGKGRLVKRALSGGGVDWLLQIFSIEPGAIVHDCDGFNHIVKGLAGVYLYRIQGRIGVNTKSWYKYDDHLEFTDPPGQLSCGCRCRIKLAIPREDIERWYRDWLNYYVPRDTGEGFVTKRHYLMHEALQRGEHICDERGIILPDFLVV